MQLLKLALKEREFILCIDETGDRKKGKTTDYLARQYIGNLGKTEKGASQFFLFKQRVSH